MFFSLVPLTHLHHQSIHSINHLIHRWEERERERERERKRKKERKKERERRVVGCGWMEGVKFCVGFDPPHCSVITIPDFSAKAWASSCKYSSNSSSSSSNNPSISCPQSSSSLKRQQQPKSATVRSRDHSRKNKRKEAWRLKPE